MMRLFRTGFVILVGLGWSLSSPETALADKAQPLAADTPSTTAAGNTFIAPAGWTIISRGNATLIEAPEGDSRIVLVDVAAKTADAAIKEAWETYPQAAPWPLKSTAGSDKDGTVSFLTTVPGFDGLELVVGHAAGKRTLVFRDAQHEYTFTEQ